MFYMEIIAVCSQIQTKHIKALCGQNVEIYKGGGAGKVRSCLFKTRSRV